MSDPFEGNMSTGSDPFSTTKGEDEFYNFEDLIKRIPEGVHNARLVDMKNQESKNGNPMIVWEFAILNGPAAGQTISSFTAITPNAMWKVSAFLAGLGLPANGFRKADALNRLCQIVVKHEVYQGQDRDTVDGVLPHPDGVGAKWRSGGESFSGGNASVPGDNGEAGEEDDAPEEETSSLGSRRRK